MAVLITLGVASSAHAQHAAAPGPPNIILYLADDVGVEALGSYGGTSYETFDETSVNDVKYFGDNLRYQDKLVGRLIDKLDSLGIRERTLVFYTSDNGTHARVTSMTNQGPVRGDKGGSLDAAMHVPLIASWPDAIAPGQVRDDLVDISDLFATIYEAGGVQIDNVRYDGVSLYSTLTQGTPSPREWIFVDYYRSRTPGPDTVRGGFGTPFRLVHDGRYKLRADDAPGSLQASSIIGIATSADKSGRMSYRPLLFCADVAARYMT